MARYRQSGPQPKYSRSPLDEAEFLAEEPVLRELRGDAEISDEQGAIRHETTSTTPPDGGKPGRTDRPGAGAYHHGV